MGGTYRWPGGVLGARLLLLLMPMAAAGAGGMGGGDTGGGDTGGGGLSFLGGIASNVADGGGHTRAKRREQPVPTSFLGGIAQNALAQKKSVLPQFMIEDTVRHKRRRGSRGKHVLDQKVACGSIQ